MAAETGVDWRFVRRSSNGDTIEVMDDRAITPAKRGTIDAGRSGGSVTRSRWSYVSMYAVAEGIPIALHDVSESASYLAHRWVADAQ